MTRGAFTSAMLAGFLAAGAAHLPARAKTSNQGGSMRLLALGDSYTIGEGVEPRERWPSQLGARLRGLGIGLADPDIVARTGWTTDELETAIAEADPRGPFDLVTLLVGVNDQYRGRGVDAYRPGFERLLATAIRFAGGDPSRVLVLSIPDWGVTPFAVGRDARAIAAEIDGFNAVAREHAERAGATFLDVTTATRAHPDELAADGLHPSGRQYARWADLALAPARRALAGARP